MTSSEELLAAHPEGGVKNRQIETIDCPLAGPLVVDTEGGRYHVQWDDEAPLTPMGQLVFFAQFLKANELFTRLCADAPFEYKSNNAPAITNVLGTLLLSVLAGHNRYAHMTALRFDNVTPPLLGMTKVVSEDSARRALEKLGQIEARTWQRRHLRACWEALLSEPWVLDIDTTIKTIYGKQEGAEVGYNPHKPGRPSHAYHTYWIARIRLCLDVEVRPGKAHAGKHGMPGLWELIDSLPRQKWPQFLRGDCGYGNEENMKECENRKLCYLFKLRQTKNVKELVRMLELQGGWVDAGQGFEGTSGSLQLMGWSYKRRVIVLRRIRKSRENQAKAALPLLDLMGGCTFEKGGYEYMVLVTSLPYSVEATAQLYRDRADSENPFDELKNQWGWGGFTTADFERCQIMARHIALIYNWWSLFVRLINPTQHSEAITSRPMILGGVARQTQHAGQKQLTVSLTHGKAAEIKEMILVASQFLKGIIAAAEQLSQPDRWRLILSRIFVKYLEGRILSEPVSALASG
jgi:hypothetical protein